MATSKKIADVSSSKLLADNLSSPHIDENYDHSVKSESSRFDLALEGNFQKGLDFLATIACGIADHRTPPPISDKNSNRTDENVVDNDSDIEGSEDFELDSLVKFDAATALDTFLPPTDHAWITEPPPGTSKEFLDDNIINPRDKRIFLARHTAYCDRVKEEELQIRLREMEISQAFQQRQIQQLLQIQRKKENKQKNKRAKIDDGKEQSSHPANDDEMIDYVMTSLKEIPSFTSSNRKFYECPSMKNLSDNIYTIITNMIHKL